MNSSTRKVTRGGAQATQMMPAPAQGLANAKRLQRPKLR